MFVCLCNEPFTLLPKATDRPRPLYPLPTSPFLAYHGPSLIWLVALLLHSSLHETSPIFLSQGNYPSARTAPRDTVDNLGKYPSRSARRGCFRILVVCDPNNDIGSENVTHARSNFVVVLAKELKHHALDTIYGRYIGECHFCLREDMSLLLRW